VPGNVPTRTQHCGTRTRFRCAGRRRFTEFIGWTSNNEPEYEYRLGERVPFDKETETFSADKLGRLRARQFEQDALIPRHVFISERFEWAAPDEDVFRRRVFSVNIVLLTQNGKMGEQPVPEPENGGDSRGVCRRTPRSITLQ